MAVCQHVASLHLSSGDGRVVGGSALETGVLPAPSFSNLDSARLSDSRVIAKQSQLNACYRQDFSYKDLCVNDLPTPVQSTFS